MNRRDFLSGSVFAATAGLALDACAPGAPALIPVLVPEEPFIPGEESWISSTCFECSAGCGLRVRKIDGRLVKVEGNPDHPLSRGGVCARGQALPQAMYHPDRIRTPLVREGARGQGSFREVTWEEALERVASELAGPFVDGGDGLGLGFVTGDVTGHRRALVERFLLAWEATGPSGPSGKARHFIHEPFPTSVVRRANRIATGHEALFGCDLERASYVVSFGAEVLESYVSPVGFARGLAEMKAGRPGRRGKLVMVGPRLSLTAANADEWIPARPGTELDLALAVAFVLIEEGLHDEDFAAAANGFAPFRDFVREHGNPSSVSDSTGVPQGRIERLARELAAHRPAVALAGGPAVRRERGTGLALAVSHLNALLGAYGDDGLLRLGVDAPPFHPWPALDDGAGPVEPESLATVLRRGDAFPHALFVSDANPGYSLPPSLALAERLDHVSLVVAFSSFPDETTRLADVVLPESMSFERFEDSIPEGAGGRLATLSGPLLVRPLYDTRSMPDALIEIARRLGWTDAFPWTSYEQALRHAWDGVSSSFDAALAAGGSWGDPRPSRAFATGDRRYHFSVESLSRGRLRDAPASLAEARRAEAGAPPSGLDLHVYASTAFGDGRSAHLPYLQDLADPVTGIRWGTVIEISESAAAEAGIGSGDLVEVRSEDRALIAPAHVSPGIHPSVVAIAAGQGHTAHGRYAEGRGANAYSLFDGSTDEDGFLQSAPGLAIRKVTG